MSNIVVNASGRLLPGHTSAESLAALRTLFPSGTPTQLARFVSGQSFAVTTVSTPAEAKKILDALRLAGIECSVAQAPLGIELQEEQVPLPLPSDASIADPLPAPEGAAPEPSSHEAAAPGSWAGEVFLWACFVLLGTMGAITLATNLWGGLLTGLAAALVTPPIRGQLAEYRLKPSGVVTFMLVFALVVAASFTGSSTETNADPADPAAAAEAQKAERYKRDAELRAAFEKDPATTLAAVNALLEQGQYAQALAQTAPLSKVGHAELDALRARAREQVRRQAAEAEVARIRAKIAAGAADPVTRAKYPKLHAAWGEEGFRKINRLLPLAAEKAAASGECDKLEYIAVSDSRSVPRKSLTFFADCANGARFYVAEADITDRAPLKPKDQILASMDRGAASLACERAIKAQLAFPLSFDLDLLSTDISQSQHKAGNLSVAFTFTAKNAFGAELPQRARCLFDDRGLIEAVITN